MASVLFVAAIGCFILTIVVFANFDKEDKPVGFIPLIGTITFAVIGFIELNKTEQNIQPTALDVYKGKTTLQITYQDSIPVDTIVIFKEEYRK